MKLIEDLLAVIPDAPVEQVTIGLHWTAVVVTVGERRRCGLASTVTARRRHGNADVPQAGRLSRLSGRALAALAHEENPTLRSIGVAAINALLPPRPAQWVARNAEQVIADAGREKRVVLVGHFPFIPRLRPRVGELLILEQNPGPEEYPAAAAGEIVPGADVLAITSMTLLNGTLDQLLGLRRSDARVLLLGPSTPLHPLLFEHGIEMLSGAQVAAIEPVLDVVREGGTFRQVHRAGVNLVTMVGDRA